MAIAITSPEMIPGSAGGSSTLRMVVSRDRPSAIAASRRLRGTWLKETSVVLTT